MLKNIDWWYIELDSNKLIDKTFYTDRNWVFNWLKLWENSITLIRDTINRLNIIMNKWLKVISNESEDNRDKVLDIDLKNGLLLEKENYVLSTQSAVCFMLEKLKSKKCYFIWNDTVWNDIKMMWLDIINISYDELINVSENNMPVFFARPPYAIESQNKDDNDILDNILNDISFKNLIKIIEKNNPKIVFCHSKPNCNRARDWHNFRELNLWFYFEYLISNYWYVNWKNIFDLWKWDYGTWDFFDMSLWISELSEYSRVIWIWDIYTDIEYTMKQWWTWILVNSWDWVNTKELIDKLNWYKWRFYNILDLSYLRIV